MAENPNTDEKKAQQPAPATADAQPGAAPAEEMQALQQMLKNYGQPLLIALAVVVAGFLVWRVYLNYRESTRQQAAQMLFQARNADELRRMADEYASTPAAPLALLFSASQFFLQGQYDAAQQAYDTFVQRHPEHAFHKAAVLGQVQCVEARGDYERALAGFREFAKANASDFLYPQAVMGEARCLEQLGRFDEARAVYEDYIAAHPDDNWSSQAESGLLFLDKTRRETLQGKPAAAPAVEMAPPTTVEAGPALEATPVAPIEASVSGESATVPVVTEPAVEKTP